METLNLKAYPSSRLHGPGPTELVAFRRRGRSSRRPQTSARRGCLSDDWLHGLWRTLSLAACRTGLYQSPNSLILLDLFIDGKIRNFKKINRLSLKSDRLLAVRRGHLCAGGATSRLPATLGCVRMPGPQSDALTLRIFVIRLVGSDLRARRFCRTWPNRPPNRRFYG
jgi:hypothetical protein